jgi:cytochrome c-type biogenesis protein CcmH/NrfG
MRRFYAISASFFLLAGLFLGCTKQAPKDDDKKDPKIEPPKVVVTPPKRQGNDPKEKDPLPIKVADDKEEKYDAALNDAIFAMADRKWDDALAAFEKARGFKNTDFVQAEIVKLKSRIDQDKTAKTTVKDLETVLNDGKADEAVKLANDALKVFGDGDEAIRLVQLSVQADALQGVQTNEGKDARYKRFCKLADDALAEKNLRAAALALEQALQAQDDADRQKTYDGIREKLDTYDALRKKAAELRRDPGQLEDALSALTDAKAAWDTLQIRSEIDECQLALQKRREAVSVANFEVRNDVGMPDAGAALADEILPKLKPKFDLVERTHLNRVVSELKLQQGFADELSQQQQLGKMAKVRYLVVGSIGRRAGVTVLARLVDLRTGLVVQTAKITAPTMDDAINLAPELAKQLMMTDEEKMANDAAVQDAKPAIVVPDNAVVPDAPPAPVADAPLPKPPIVNFAPPDFANMKRDAFKVLAPPPQGFVAPDPEPLVVQQRNRLLFATVEMGDFLFRAGRFGEARRQYEFALLLAPDNREIQLRVENVLPLAPPIVVVVGQPVYYVKPRLAVLPFMTVGDAFVVPPALSYWTPANLAPYFSSRYEVVDPTEIYWYMGRMGMTMQDLMNDPNARRWLGRAVGVRYFVLGSCVQTTSFDVNTYLLDTELGYLQGAATINVRDPYELKLRLPELAELTMMSPADRIAYLAQLQQQQYFQLVADGRRHMVERNFLLAKREFERALGINPNDVQVQVWLVECAQQVRFQDFIDASQQQYRARRTDLEAQRQRQIQLAKEAEQARRRAIALEASRSNAERQAHFSFRFQARDSMVVQAQFALKTNRFGISVSLFQGAMDIGAVVTPGVPAPAPIPAAVFQDFARARQQAELRDAQLTAARETAIRQVREQQLADAQKQLVKERELAKAKLDAVRAAQGKRDEGAFKAGIAKGQKFMAQNKYEAALASFQGAQRVAGSAEQSEQVNKYIDIIVQRQAEALGKTEQERNAIASKLDAERNRRKLAEEQYKGALNAAQKALAVKNLDTAQAKFEDAGKLFKTDAVLTGLQQVQSARSALAAEQKKTEADPAKSDTIKTLIADGKAALSTKNYADAAKKFQQAKKLAPNNLDALAGLAQAESAIGRPKTDPPVVVPEKAKLSDLLAAGQTALKAKNYDAAEKALRSASLLDPTNPAVVQGLKDAAQGRKALEDSKQALADYQAALGVGQKALQTKSYDEALKSFQQALKLMPNDAVALKLLAQAQDAKNLAAKTSTNFQQAMDAGQAALKNMKYADAVKAFNDAIKLDPNDARARKLLAQAQQAIADADVAAKTQAYYLKAMTTGQTALTAKRYPDAVTAFKDALRWVPNDQKATQQLAAAQKAILDTPKVKTPPPADPAKQFTDAMQRASAAEKDKKYADAVKAYTEALKIRPKDADAIAGWKENRFSLYLWQGQQYLNNAMWMAAQTEFESALGLFPNNNEAKKLLQKAKGKMK